MKILISKIDANPAQPRKDFNETALRELADSIAANGLLQAITVRATKGGRYQIVAGERRWRAVKLLGRKTIAASIVRKSDIARDIAAIVENLQRADVTPIEEANAFKRLVDKGLTVEEIAKRLGLAEFRVRWRLQLLNLAPAPLKLFEAGQLDRQQALELARLPEPAEQIRVVQMINRGQLLGWKSVRCAVDALIDGTTQADIFGEVAPHAAEKDLETLSSMERRILSVATMVGAGWYEGECKIAAKVNPDRAALMADKLAAIQQATRTMERELRNLAAQALIALPATEGLAS